MRFRVRAAPLLIYEVLYLTSVVAICQECQVKAMGLVAWALVTYCAADGRVMPPFTVLACPSGILIVAGLCFLLESTGGSVSP
jgi:hypothetical protein